MDTRGNPVVGTEIPRRDDMSTKGHGAPEYETESVSVLGAGLMGHTIALNIAWGGMEVTLQGIDAGDIERAREEIRDKIGRLRSAELFTEKEAELVESRIRCVTSVEEAVIDCTFVIEAIPEDLKLKQQFYRQLDTLCPEHTILASNTSALSPTEIAANMKHPERMVVVHFWNPAHLIPLVEVVRGKKTGREAVERSIRLMLQLGKKPIEVKKNVPGFVGNRLQYALLREAAYLLETGVASREDIDAAVVYGIGRRYPVTGPLVSADLGGLDVFHAVSEYVFPDLADHKASLLTMRELVKDGHHGVKSGKGFFEWDQTFTARIQAERENFLMECLKKDWKE